MHSSLNLNPVCPVGMPCISHDSDYMELTMCYTPLWAEIQKVSTWDMRKQANVVSYKLLGAKPFCSEDNFYVSTRNCNDN